MTKLELRTKLNDAIFAAIKAVVGDKIDSDRDDEKDMIFGIYADRLKFNVWISTDNYESPLAIRFESANDVFNHSWVGNAYYDMAAFRAVDGLVKRLMAKGNETEARAAVNEMGVSGMGLEPMKDDSEWAAYLKL